MGSLAIFDWTIANGATTSNAIDLREYEIVAFQADTSFDGATIGFVACAAADPTMPGGPGYDVVVDDAGVALAVTITDDRYIVCVQATREKLQGLCWTKIVSASTETGAQSLKVIARRSL